VAGLGRKEGKQEDAHHRRRHRGALPERELLLLIGEEESEVRRLTDFCKGQVSLKIREARCRTRGKEMLEQ
jgi:predicted GTPase